MKIRYITRARIGGENVCVCVCVCVCVYTNSWDYQIFITQNARKITYNICET